MKYIKVYTKSKGSFIIICVEAKTFLSENTPKLKCKEKDKLMLITNDIKD